MIEIQCRHCLKYKPSYLMKKDKGKPVKICKLCDVLEHKQRLKDRPDYKKRSAESTARWKEKNKEKIKKYNRDRYRRIKNG